MICLKQNYPDYDYDIRSLIMAFFSGQKITTTEAGSDFVLEVQYENHQVSAWIKEKGESVVKSQMTCDYTQKKLAKNAIKRLIYLVLSDYTKKELPWGTLTGIRPTKIAVDLLEKGKSKEFVRQHFQDTFLTSAQKAKISSGIAKKELKLLSDLPKEDAYSLYIGIPFCPSTCLYCSFTSFPIKLYENIVEDYLKALFKEIDYAAKRYLGKKLVTVYIGGGTPTSLNADQIDRLLRKIKESFSFDYVKEFTIEAGRPDSITREKLTAAKNNGITRISINPQTMKDETLKLIGRAHSVEQTRLAYQMARDTGFDNINMDVITGLPGEDINDIADTLNEICKMAPESLTVHSLAIKRAANLNIEMEKYRSLVKGSTDAMLQLADQYAQRMNLAPYYLYRQKNIPGNLENIGYAKEGKECFYNILIMEERHDILALGAGASSKFVFPKEKQIIRVENVKDVRHYIERIDEMIERKQKVEKNNE